MRFLTDQGPAFDVVNANFSAAGVRQISFGNTYPVKARERRGEEVRSEKGGGWIGWALFRSGTNQPASAIRPAAKRNASFPLKVSENRRYLVDQTGQAFFVMNDTPWFIQNLIRNGRPSRTKRRHDCGRRDECGQARDDGSQRLLGTPRSLNMVEPAS